MKRLEAFGFLGQTLVAKGGRAINSGSVRYCQKEGPPSGHWDTIFNVARCPNNLPLSNTPTGDGRETEDSR